MTHKRIYRGIWDGLTTVSVARLMGTTPRIARLRMSKKIEVLDRNLTLEDIGDLVYEYKSGIPKSRVLDDLLDKRWTGPIGL